MEALDQKIEKAKEQVRNTRAAQDETADDLQGKFLRRRLYFRKKIGQEEACQIPVWRALAHKAAASSNKSEFHNSQVLLQLIQLSKAGIFILCHLETPVISLSAELPS